MAAALQVVSRQAACGRVAGPTRAGRRLDNNVPQCMRHITSGGTAIDGIDTTGSKISEQPQGRLVQRGALLAQGEDLLSPVALTGKPGEMHGEGRVIPAPRQPGA